MPILLDYNTYLENEIVHINQTFREHVHKDQVKKELSYFCDILGSSCFVFCPSKVLQGTII